MRDISARYYVGLRIHVSVCLDVKLVIKLRMAEQARMLRVVVASPSDVKAEGEVVSSILEELNKSVCVDRGLRLEVIVWETDTYPGFHIEGPQGLIDPIIRVEDCDVLIGIFWKRFGTPVGDAPSGTEHEIRHAHAAWKKSGRPQIMVYFNQKPYTPQSKLETDQWGQVLEFRKDFPQEGLWWPYKGTANFERLLRKHLTNFLRATFLIGQSQPADQFNVASQQSQPHPRKQPSHSAYYFAVQSRIIEEYTRTFVGRIHAQQAFQRFVEKNKSGYFLVRGGPGQGKTALSCQLVKAGRYAHHFISRTGGRTDARLILCSLLSQLLPSDDGNHTTSESQSELTKTFEEVLSTVASHGEKVVIVVDALDELPDTADDPPCLPSDALPDGVFFFITSRPGGHLDRLRERLFAIPNELYELGPLELSEMRDILTVRKPDITAGEIERIAEASQGNPLYLRAVADELADNPHYNLQDLPDSIEGFFRKATSSLRVGNAILGDVLGLLSVARKPFSLRELSLIAGVQQREIYDHGISPIQQFLLETHDGYNFYHARFHEFVTRTILYEDELRKAHRRMADWLEHPRQRAYDYRFNSLAHHLFESGARDELIEKIDETFLAETVRRFGYAVLEDVELLTRALLERGDPALVERCVSIVETLRQVIGGDIVPDIAKSLQPYRSGPEAFRTRLIEPPVPCVPALDTYVGVLPKGNVSADFFEVVAVDNRLVVALGDAPSVGLKSAFVARFIGNLFHQLVLNSKQLDLGKILTRINSTICNHDYFKRISMQCIDIDPRRGIVRLANAGHPYPVHYSARRGKCDILPLTGDLLNSGSPVTEEYQEYMIKINAQDAIVLVTDGLTEGHILTGDPYGYRFTQIVESRAGKESRAIGQAILDDWKAYPREEDIGDDASVIVITFPASSGDSTR